jgi:hypothetical protein
VSAPCGCATYGYDSDGGDLCTLWREERIGSVRVEHQCCECGDAIPVGSRCCKASGLYGGEWFTQYRCVSCAVLAEYVAEELKTCPLWGGLSEVCADAGVDFSVYRATGRFSLYDSDEEESA